LSSLNIKEKQLDRTSNKKYQTKLSVPQIGVSIKQEKNNILSQNNNNRIEEGNIKNLELTKLNKEKSYLTNKEENIYVYKNKSSIRLGIDKTLVPQKIEETNAESVLISNKMPGYHVVGKQMNNIRKIEKR
jgi:hypothetical protein